MKSAQMIKTNGEYRLQLTLGVQSGRTTIEVEIWKDYQLTNMMKQTYEGTNLDLALEEEFRKVAAMVAEDMGLTS